MLNFKFNSNLFPWLRIPLAAPGAVAYKTCNYPLGRDEGGVHPRMHIRAHNCWPSCLHPSGIRAGPHATCPVAWMLSWKCLRKRAVTLGVRNPLLIGFGRQLGAGRARREGQRYF